MSTPLTDAITALTTYANSITGKSDTNLPDAVRSLADGYGQGGGRYDGAEFVTDSSNDVTSIVWHGKNVPNNAFLKLFNGSGVNRPLSFADHPTNIGTGAFSQARVRIDWSGLDELVTVGGAGQALRLEYSTDCSADVATLPKYTGYSDNGNESTGIFAYATAKAPSTYIFPVIQRIPREAFTNISNTNFNITFGSVGHAVQSCGAYPFHNSTAAASGTVTTYTTGEYLSTIKTALENAIGSGNIAFIYKASEATTYNGVSYSAGDTITV